MASPPVFASRRLRLDCKWLDRAGVATLAMLVVWLASRPLGLRADEPAPTYAVIVSKRTNQEADWHAVVEALVAKHRATVVEYQQLEEARKTLATLRPRYACFVATLTEANRQFVADVHQLTRRLDDDPYTDMLWGILTGYDAATAQRIASHRDPLEVKRVAAGTEVELAACDEGVWYCELKKGKVVRKSPGGDAKRDNGPADTTKALADTLNEYHADLFVTSGHATERDWQIGFAYRNGVFRSDAGQLFGVDTQGQRHPIKSENPKVYLPVGNCLMGHIDGPDAMALAFMKSAGVNQMVGYTVPTWFGYAGWGMLDYFVEQPGRYTMAEAFFANHQALLHKLETEFPQDARRNLPPGEFQRNGLLFDRDVLAFYGDPAWEARMKPGPLAWRQTLTHEGDRYTLTITPQRGEASFDPINKNGSQRGGRPIVALLPRRIKQAEILEGESLKPVITDDFVLVPLPAKCDPEQTYRVVFRAQDATTTSK